MPGWRIKSSFLAMPFFDFGSRELQSNALAIQIDHINSYDLSDRKEER